MAKKPSATSAEPAAADLQGILDGLRPAPAAPGVAASTGMAEDGAGDASQGPQPSTSPASADSEGVPAEQDQPLVELSATVYDDLRPIQGVFTDDDEIPAGFTPVEIKPYVVDKPLTAQIPLLVGMDVTFDPADPLAEARRSLQEDAARARAHQARLESLGGDSSPNGPRTHAVPVVKRPPDQSGAVREAMARAATQTPLRYRSRITVAAAWQFRSMADAPEWIDRNWIGYDHGPAVIVPEVGSVHRGDWVVLESVLDDDGSVSHQQLKVYDDAMFRALFMAERSVTVTERSANMEPANG